MPVHNSEIARLFERLADLLELEDAGLRLSIIRSFLDERGLLKPV